MDFYTDVLLVQNAVGWSRKENVRAIWKPSMPMSGRQWLRTNDKIEIDSIFTNDSLHTF